MQLRHAAPPPAAPEPPAPRRTIGLRLPRLRGRSVTAALGAVLIGIAGTATVGTPAAAAPPTISAPAYRVGWGYVEITGTATPGTEVQLYEGAYIHWVNAGRGYGATYIAERWTDPNIDAPTNDIADDAGNWSIRRIVDSGLVFYVMAGQERSPVAVVASQVFGYNVVMTPNGSGSLHVSANAAPGEQGVPVQLQRKNGAGWVNVGAELATAPGGLFSATYTGEPAGEHTYRLAFGAQPENNLLPGYSDWDYVVNNSSTTAGRQDTDGTTRPSQPPTTAPTTQPSSGPTSAPTTSPTSAPTSAPTTSPTSAPTNSPTSGPTSAPTTSPTAGPTKAPTPGPTPPPARPVPPAPPGAGSVKFTRINYDAPGRDTKTKKSMNGEWVRLTNTTRAKLNLHGWTVRDAAGHVYRFRTSVYLAPGKSVYVHTGSGTNGNPGMHRYWHASSHLWNNGGDTAVLRSPTGKKIDSCRWTKDRNYTTC